MDSANMNNQDFAHPGLGNNPDFAHGKIPDLDNPDFNDPWFVDSHEDISKRLTKKRYSCDLDKLTVLVEEKLAEAKALNKKQKKALRRAITKKNKNVTCADQQGEYPFLNEEFARGMSLSGSSSNNNTYKFGSRDELINEFMEYSQKKHEEFLVRNAKWRASQPPTPLRKRPVEFDSDEEVPAGYNPFPLEELLESSKNYSRKMHLMNQSALP